MNKTLFALSALSVLSSCSTKTEKKSTAPKPKRPNIVFIMSDDHDQKEIGAYGDTIGKLAPTPNIDRIAHAGARFNNNFVTNSLCGPSRAVILTGKFSHKNGYRGNFDHFDNNQVTFPKILHQNGYTTAMVGKWHLGGQPQGFDYWSIVDGQGNYYNPKFFSINDTSIVHGYATDIITEKALNWLKNGRDKSKPFCLMLHHKAPHRNQMPPKRYYNLYDHVKFPEPDSYYPKFDKSQLAARNQMMSMHKDMLPGYDLKMTKKLGSPELAWDPFNSEFERMTKEQRADWDKAYQPKNDAEHRAHLKGKALDDWKYQRFMEDYCATVRAVDDGVGEVLDYLKANGLDKNTIVIYTSDQGFWLGENGWFDKRFMYETSFHTPFLIEYPGHIDANSQVYALTQNVDYAETILDYAGIKAPSNMQGKSFRPLLEHKIKDEDFRNAIYYHYYDYPSFHMVMKHDGVRTNRYKLIHFYDDADYWELYDLKNDPEEQHNLYNAPKYKSIQAIMHQKLDSLKTLYQVNDSTEYTKSTPASVKAMRQFFQNFAGYNGHYEKFNLKKFLEAKTAK